ncbi:hypothetical protein PAXRUDRAFT_16393 [Paxillus rubicundulus Ve08.2h10]|uniref:Uncharacterized protein n=1 Tax=Paxillus rubicundulus Ve08.2h10 TaxID=930991 RepID=A0A0D0DEH8_9AGAM|nr:hypothetical protein PAXRUDRAFT_16393 [Paxillus rubicundulus Ve08.2h10]
MQSQVQCHCHSQATAPPSISPVVPLGPLVQSFAPDVAPVAAQRTCRNRHPPACYRDQADDTEEFDIHHHSDVSDDTDPGLHDLHPAAIVVATPNSLATINSTSGHGNPTITNPLATDRSAQNPAEDPLATNTSSSSNKELDIEYFFRKEAEGSICKVCKATASYNIQYHFSSKTSNTPLCHHVKVRHALLYLEQAEK